MSNKPVYISMLVATLFWSGAFIAGKMAGTVFMPLTLTFFRFFFALPFIFLLLKIKEPANFVPAKEQIMPLIILGIVGTLGYHYFFFMALRYTTATNSALIGATNPMVTTVLAVLFFKEKITALRLAGVGISLFGVFSVITGLDPQIIGEMAFNRGDLLMFLGVLCFSVYALLSRKYMMQYKISPLTATAYSFLVCTILSLVFSLFLENPLAAAGQAPGRVWLEILYMSILASVIGYYVQLNSIQKIGAPKTMIFINLVPVNTIILARVILNEEISLLKILMALVIILGVYLTARPEKESKSSNR
ncbi:MAG: DMT family transporter [Desulfitobacteriia bacterium]|jgi:drug/metabolite transporter (DMT)-like permease